MKKKVSDEEAEKRKKEKRKSRVCSKQVD